MQPLVVRSAGVKKLPIGPHAADQLAVAEDEDVDALRGLTVGLGGRRAAGRRVVDALDQVDVRLGRVRVLAVRRAEVHAGEAVAEDVEVGGGALAVRRDLRRDREAVGVGVGRLLADERATSGGDGDGIGAADRVRPGLAAEGGAVGGHRHVGQRHAADPDVQRADAVGGEAGAGDQDVLVALRRAGHRRDAGDRRARVDGVPAGHRGRRDQRAGGADRVAARRHRC